MKKKIISLFSIFVFMLMILGTPAKANSKIEAKRLYGNDRYQTCSQIVTEGWQTSKYAVIVNGENFPDALSSSVLAKKYSAPILLTQSNNLDTNTKAQLIRLKVEKVFLIGGTGVINIAVENTLHSMNISTERFYGADRNATSVAVAQNIGTDNGIILTTDNDYTDALSVAPIASKLQMPIILVPKDSVPTSVSNFISGKSIPRTYVLGDSDLISDAVIVKFPNRDRIPGKDKYERNINIINAFSDKFDFSNACLAYSEGFADALSGSAFAAINGNPIILVGNSPAAVTKNFISNKGITKIDVIGGTAGINESTLLSLIGTSTQNNSPTNVNTNSVPTLAPTPSPAPAPVINNQSQTVYVTKTGKKYHRDGCSSLRKSKIPMSLQDAKNAGYTPCEKCNPPQ